MRTISNKLKVELFGQTSGDPFLVLLTISHSSFSTIYLVNNTKDIVSRGNTYIAFPFKIVLPMDDGETMKEAMLEIDNVSGELVDELRQVTTPIDVRMELILASDPATVEVDLGEMQIRSISYDKNVIQAKLYLDDFLNTEVASEKYTPSLFPGIFS